MSHSQRRFGVGILIPLLALVASACATPPPPKVELEYEQRVKPGLVLVAIALNEQGFDTAVIDSQLSAGSHSFKIKTDGDGDPWTATHTRAAISGAADSLDLAGFDCNRWPGYPAVNCYTEFWYIDVQHSPDLFNWGLFVSVSGRDVCWEDPQPSYCSGQQVFTDIRRIATELGREPPTADELATIHERVDEFDEMVASGASCDDVYEWADDRYVNALGVIDVEGLTFVVGGIKGWGTVESFTMVVECEPIGAPPIPRP